MTFGGWSAPSEDELEQGGDYTTLPEDEYVARVTSVELKKDQPNKFPSKNDNEPFHDMLVLKADALTFADGEPLVDINDEPVEGSVPFQVWLNPKKKGMIPQPSKTRRAFAAILGVAVGDSIDISSWDELVGKTFIVSLKPNGTYNNADQFRPIKRARSRGTTPKGPVEGDDLLKRAKEVFNEDAPDNVDPIQQLANDAPPILPVRKRGAEKVRPVETTTAGSAEDDLDF